MTLETLNKDMITAWKAGDLAKKNALVNMIDVIKKASMTSKGRTEITEALVDETLIKYQKAVQEQYDTCPDTEKYQQRKADYLIELGIVKEYAPQLLTDYDGIKSTILALLDEHGALVTKPNRGAVMKIIAPAMKGKADMAVVNRVVGELLT